MPRPHSLRDYLSTKSVSQPFEGGTGLAHEVYQLEWAKEVLDIPHIDNEQDVRLLLAMRTAQAIIEDKANISFAPVVVEAEFTNPSNKRTPVLEMPGSDFAHIRRITEYGDTNDVNVFYNHEDAVMDEDGVEIKPFEAVRMRKRLYLRRTDGKHWPHSAARGYRETDVVVTVEAERRVWDRTQKALIKAAMDMLIVELDESNPATGKNAMGDSPSFLRLMESLKSATPTPGFS